MYLTPPNAKSPGDQNQFSEGFFVHFLHDPVSIRLDRPFGRAKFKRNLLVDLASDHQIENLPLPCCEVILVFEATAGDPNIKHALNLPVQSVRSARGGGERRSF